MIEICVQVNLPMNQIVNFVSCLKQKDRYKKKKECWRKYLDRLLTIEFS